jgi:hypothetical protein
VTAILGRFLGIELLHPAIHFTVDVLSLSKRAVAERNVELHADMTHKQATTDCAGLLALRSSAPIGSLTRYARRGGTWLCRQHSDA